jgi:hypothetical protein
MTTEKDVTAARAKMATALWKIDDAIRRNGFGEIKDLAESFNAAAAAFTATLIALRPQTK